MNSRSFTIVLGCASGNYFLRKFGTLPACSFYLIDDETRDGAEHNYAEEARCSRWFTVRGPLIITFAYYSFTSLPSHLEAWFAFTAQKLQCFQSYPTCLYSYTWFCLFVKQVGTRAHLYWASVFVGAKNSFALDCRVIFPNWLRICAV